MLRVVQALLSSFCLTLSAMAATPVFVIHGGAGVISKEITPEKEKAYRAELQRALEAGYAVLKDGGSSLDAVTKAIV
ncbi:MAG TPA: isoaspartyl peptidase/L-asparaginase, partial [Rudaea sp.]|nr:isoaspartyl peptidase/L-asparaginase [Rudaea sp.]